MVRYVIVIAVLAVVLAVLLCRAARSTSPPRILTLGPSFFFWLGMGYLVLLLLGAAAYAHLYRDPSPFLIRGVLPVAVPWFGSLGAVVISLEGVFLKNGQWDSRFNYWHIGRPLFGAVLGTVSFFLYLFIISASGTQPKFLDPDQSTTALDFNMYYIVAFLVGYREATFRDLIKRVTDLVLKPSTPSDPLPDLVFRQNGQAVQRLAFPSNPVGTPVRQTLELCNAGTAPLRSPRLEITGPGPETTPFSLAGKPGKPGGDLAPGETWTVDLAFTPPAAQSYAAVLNVKADNLPAPRTLPLSGTGIDSLPH
ncbi:hypothetical protein [Mesoterricola silvestris]|uniref:DUF1573 domain-containing protein n=1 Tax=Mesoterricola silvestris TaxID=2927979 RepID=A0AA48GJY2_9BACT|nr:hypothetical protein [Mesoterricola silvestris]BDU72702.1 hypothetical protein METEAL_18760 [Mesoterricola silvestris]